MSFVNKFIKQFAFVRQNKVLSYKGKLIDKLLTYISTLLKYKLTKHKNDTQK